MQKKKTPAVIFVFCKLSIRHALFGTCIRFRYMFHKKCSFDVIEWARNENRMLELFLSLSYKMEIPRVNCLMEERADRWKLYTSFMRRVDVGYKHIKIGRFASRECNWNLTDRKQKQLKRNLLGLEMLTWAQPVSPLYWLLDYIIRTSSICCIKYPYHVYQIKSTF